MGQPELNSLIEEAAAKASAFALWRLPHAHRAHLCVSFSPCGKEYNGKSGFLFHPFTQTPHTPAVFIDAEAEASCPVQDIVQVDLKYNPTVTIETPEASQEDYISFVRRSVEAIRQKRFDKIVAARAGRLPMPRHFNLLAVFRKLCDKYPDAFVSLVHSHSAGTWLGATPELLMAVDGTSLSTFALAGTRLQNRSWTDKEYDEQQWVRTYIENLFKTHGLQPQTSALREIAAGNGLVHLLNEIRASVPQGMGTAKVMQLVTDMHPTPAIAGTPRPQALEWLQQAEPLHRSYYSGFLGPIQSTGDMQLFVNLRCMQVMPESLVLYAGAGITAGSEAEKEWEETRQKMNVIASVLS